MIKNWTDEETDFLEERWGQMTLPGIAKKLGKSENAVKLKAGKLGLGDSRQNYNGFTLHSLSKILHVDYKKITNWVERYDFPVKEKIFVRKKVLVVTEKAFWKWAEENKQMIDFSKIEPNTFGNEPQWMKDKRNADIIKARKVKKSNESAWSVEEDNILTGMLSAFIYTYPEIADRLKRSEGSIKSRIKRLGLKARPIRSSVTYPDDVIRTKEEKKRWSEEDLARLKRLAWNGKNTVVDTARKLDTTVRSVKDILRYYDIPARFKPYIDPRDSETGRLMKDPNRPEQKVFRKPWTEEEDRLIKDMCEQKHTLPEIAKRLAPDRTVSALKNRVRKLGVKARPLDEYTPEQTQLVETLVQKGHCMEDIAERVGKSALGVRGKLERMGYKFKNGVPIPPGTKKTDEAIILEKYL